jgi:hypothetical protein
MTVLAAVASAASLGKDVMAVLLETRRFFPF